MGRFSGGWRERIDPSPPSEGCRDTFAYVFRLSLARAIDPGRRSPPPVRTYRRFLSPLSCAREDVWIDPLLSERTRRLSWTFPHGALRRRDTFLEDKERRMDVCESHLSYPSDGGEDPIHRVRIHDSFPIESTRREDESSGRLSRRRGGLRSGNPRRIRTVHAWSVETMEALRTHVEDEQRAVPYRYLARSCRIEENEAKR